MQPLNPYIRYTDALDALQMQPQVRTAINTFVRVIERRLDAELLIPAEKVSNGHPELSDLLTLAEELRCARIIHALSTTPHMEDEPPLFNWKAQFRTSGEDMWAGGSSTSPRHALTAAIAEGLERHIWFERDDYFTPVIAKLNEVRGPFVSPEAIAGVSPTVRMNHPHLNLSRDTAYAWMKGYSWTDSRSVSLPAQIISGHTSIRHRVHSGEEPLIREAITTGLATHPNRIQALLSGALEVLERDAYMITWLNQLTPPRVPLDALCSDPDCFSLIQTMRRYRLTPHIVRLVTDAPCYCVAAIVIDDTGGAPRTTVGLAAHRSIDEAAKKALVEALRARANTRLRLLENVPTHSEVDHRNRLIYWAHGERDRALEFLWSGNEQILHREPWETDTVETHLDRITAWCRSKQYQLISVPFTTSKANIPQWHIEMVVIPDMLPLAFSNLTSHIDAPRRREVPSFLGLHGRDFPFTEEPHPFA